KKESQNRQQQSQFHGGGAPAPRLPLWDEMATHRRFPLHPADGRGRWRVLLRVLKLDDPCEGETNCPQSVSRQARPGEGTGDGPSRRALERRCLFTVRSGWRTMHLLLGKHSSRSGKKCKIPRGAGKTAHAL